MVIKHSVVVITGASSGIGRATAIALAKRHAIVVLGSRGAEALTAVADEVRAHGGEPLRVPVDVRDGSALTQLADRVIDRYGRIDAWVHTAGVVAVGSAEVTPVDDVERVLDVNIMGSLHVARAALPHFRRQGRGTLVLASSVLGLQPQPYNAAYCMSKAAVRSLASSLRQELALDGVRGVNVCTLLPATIDTPIWEHAANYSGRQVHPIPPIYTADRVASGIMGLLARPRRELIVGPSGHVVSWGARFAPALAESLTAAVTQRTLLGSRPAEDTTGNLYKAAPGPGSITGAYHGRARTALRRAALAAALTGALVGTARLARRSRPT